MSRYVKALINTDIEFGDHDSRFRFFFDFVHCLNLVRATMIVHAVFGILPILYYIPYSLPTVPIYVVVLGSSTYGVKHRDALALLPLQIYIATMLSLSACALLLDPVFVYYFRNDIYSFFNYNGGSSFSFLLLILSNTILTHIVVIGMLFWQYRSVSSCREFFSEAEARVAYDKVAVSDSFMNTTTPETMSFSVQKPKYAVFSLEPPEDREQDN